MDMEKANMVGIMKRQLDGSLEMLEKALELCPLHLWNRSDMSAPVWQHFYHALFFVNVWLKDWTRDPELPSFHVKEALDLKKTPGRLITKEQMKTYLDDVRSGSESFFKALAPDSLEQESENWGKLWTGADRIMAQIRHVQHHVGYINAILRMNEATPAQWIGYNE